MTMKYWVRLIFGTGLVETDDDDIIIDAMPILRKFIGQPFSNLETWGPYIERKEI